MLFGVVGGLRPVWPATVGGVALLEDRGDAYSLGQGGAARFFARPPGSAKPSADAQKNHAADSIENANSCRSHPAKCGKPIYSKSNV
jgi:hypothetical protein